MRRPFALVVTAALVLAACGNPGSSSAPTTSSPSPSTTQSLETTTAPTTAGNPVVADDQQTLTVGGLGRMYAEPVRAVVDLGVTVRRPTVYEATRVAARSAEAMRDVLLEQGIDPKDIQTTDYYVGTYSLDWPTITGYETTIGYRVSIPDVGTVGVVLAAATEAGGDDVRASGIRFEADATALTDDARA
ncbi:MAG: SIMPL domain-containing protein, partial [Acidimicrobiia bacterium]